MAAQPTGQRADALGRGIACKPALCTRPVTQQVGIPHRAQQFADGGLPLEVVQRQRQRQSPQCLMRCARAEEGQALLTQLSPVRRRLIRRQGLAAQLLAPGLDRPLASFQTQGEAAVMPAGRRDRQRRAAPSIQVRQRLGEADFQTQRFACHRARHHLERDFTDHAQRALGAAHQARQVIARHVLHHFTTETQRLAVGADDARAQHQVAQAAAPGAAWAAEPRGESAADGRRGPEVGWLAAQVLTLLGEHGLQRRQRGAGAHRDHQLHRVVVGDAMMRAHVEHFLGGHFTA